MPTPADDALDLLDALERGFVLGVLLLGTADDVDVTATLAPPSRERCGAALAALAGLPRAERLRITGAMAREAMSPLPSGIEAADPEQLAAALAGESPAIVSLVARGAPRALRAALLKAGGAEGDATLDSEQVSGNLDAALIAELQRAALAPIVAVPPGGAVPARRQALALAQRPGALLAEAAELGTAALGRSLADAEAEGLGAADLLLAIAQRLPPALGNTLLEAADACRRARAESSPKIDVPPYPVDPAHHRR